MVNAFAFEHPDETYFWLVEGTALENSSSVRLTEELRENWKLFDV